jgi:hypothetical protein
MTATRTRRASSPVRRLNALGLVVATIAGNGFSETLGDPGELGGFLGALVQIAGLLIALPAGVVAVRNLGSRQIAIT